MRGVIPTTPFFFLFVVLALSRHVFSINTLSSSETLTISSNRTIVSPDDVFELGFFTTGGGEYSYRWYLGIWYKKITERTFVWIANRDNPLSNSTGTLKISYTNLVLSDQYETPVWSTNLTKTVKSSPVVAELLANGNLVLKDSNTNEFLWQSFDFPVDTLVPEMKLGQDLKTGYNRFLTSWKSPDFTFKLETQGLPEFYLRKNEILVYRTGPWDGIQFSGMPNMQNGYVVSNFIENGEEVAYTFKVTNQSIHLRLTMSDTGLLQMLSWIPTLSKWNMFWVFPKDECDSYGICGPYSYCDVKTTPFCNCIKGYDRMNMDVRAFGEDLDGCVRKSPLSCSGDWFLRMKNMKLPETSTAVVDRSIGLKECSEKCSRNCNCTGFANADIRNGSGCVIWTGELVDMMNYGEEGQDLYVKLAGASATRRVVVDISFILLIYYIIIIGIIIYY